MKKIRAGHIISLLLVVFTLSLLAPSCAVTTTQTGQASRKSLMMPSTPDRSNPKKVRRAKPSREYKKSRKRSNYYKKRKHKYK